MKERPPHAVYAEAAEKIRGWLPSVPRAAVVLGSGLDGFATALNDRRTLSYKDIPSFPQSTVSYQNGTLEYATSDGVPVLLMNGRFHYYEGWEMWQTSFPIAVFSMLGIRTLILTNAAGALNPKKYAVGDLVALTDHIKLSPDSPLRGGNDEQLGTRFPDMQTVYNRTLRARAQAAAADLGFALKTGVYAFMAGPQFETPAEIRALSVLGADLVGMSTVAEVIEAAHSSMRVLCISSVTNYAAGIGHGPCSVEEVLNTAKINGTRLVALLRRMLTEIETETEDENTVY